MSDTTVHLRFADIAARIEKLQDEIFDAQGTASSEADDLHIEVMEGELRELQTQADRENPALAFARWLQVETRLIGEDVNIDRLYGQWREDDEPYCNHDPAALNPVEVNQCECGAIVPLLPEEDETPKSGNCERCGELIHWSEGMGGMIDDQNDQYCPDGERHELPADF